MKTFTVCTRGPEGVWILSNKEIELESFNDATLKEISELALGETSGSPKDGATDYIHVMADITMPRYKDTQAAAITAFGLVLDQKEYGGMIHCRLLPDEGVEVNENKTFIAPEGKMNMN